MTVVLGRACKAIFATANRQLEDWLITAPSWISQARLVLQSILYLSRTEVFLLDSNLCSTVCNQASLLWYGGCKLF